ncbi:MAG: hypothetical protein ACYS0H_19405, partial [Planctomycetota bacterium]
ESIISFTWDVVSGYWGNAYFNVMVEDAGGKKAILAPGYNSAASTGWDTTDGSTTNSYCLFEAEPGWTGTTSIGWYAATWDEVKNLTITDGPFTEFPDTLTGAATAQNDPVYTVSNWAAWADLAAGADLDWEQGGVMITFGQSTGGNPATTIIENIQLLVADTEGPIASNVVAGPVPIDTIATLTATIDDSTTGNSNIASAEYGQGESEPAPGSPMTPVDGFDSPTEDVTVDLGSFSDPGVHKLWVRGTDAEGNTGEWVSTLLAVYDPAGGFVTGGGWIESPWHDDYIYMGVEGKASFGFVSKYKKGAQAPTGNTEFVFQAADLNFHSSSYQWLVVNQAGENAQFKGSGTINGAGDYKFMLWAGDGAPDTFQIKIWEEIVEGVEFIYYDNGVDQPIGGGSIIIHKGKK